MQNTNQKLDLTSQTGATLLSTIVAAMMFGIAVVVFAQVMVNTVIVDKRATVSSYALDLDTKLESGVIKATRIYVNDQKCVEDPYKTYIGANGKTYRFLPYANIITAMQIGSFGALVNADPSFWAGMNQDWKKSQRHAEVLQRCASFGSKNSMKPSDKKLHICYLLVPNAETSSEITAAMKTANKNSLLMAGVNKGEFAVVEMRMDFVDLATYQSQSCVDASASLTSGTNVFYGIYWSRMMRNKELGFFYDIGNFLVAH